MASAERLVERRLRVLLADDSQSNRLVLAELLRRRGCEVDVATNGQEAVDSVLRALHDVVIMDIDMPVMDGVAALQAIRRLGGMQSRLPVVAMTAHAAPTARADFLAAGFDDYLAKPVDSGVLMETVARCATVLQSATTEAANISHIGPAEAGAWLAQHGERALETAALRRLAQEVGQERLPRMVRIFSEELERRAGLIRTALEQGDMAVLGRESHVLKGSAATFGAHELQRHASRLNDACRREARQDALECSGQLLAAVPRTLEALRAALQEAAL
jgi:CheY-like chemotaxis protein